MIGAIGVIIKKKFNSAFKICFTFKILFFMDFPGPCLIFFSSSKHIVVICFFKVGKSHALQQSSSILLAHTNVTHYTKS